MPLFQAKEDSLEETWEKRCARVLNPTPKLGWETSKVEKERGRWVAHLWVHQTKEWEGKDLTDLIPEDLWDRLAKERRGKDSMDPGLTDLLWAHLKASVRKGFH